MSYCFRLHIGRECSLYADLSTVCVYTCARMRRHTRAIHNVDTSCFPFTQGERVKLDTKPGHRPGLCTVCVAQDEEKAVEEDTMSHDHTP